MFERMFGFPLLLIFACPFPFIQLQSLFCVQIKQVRWKNRKCSISTSNFINLICLTSSTWTSFISFWTIAPALIFTSFLTRKLPFTFYLVTAIFVLTMFFPACYSVIPNLSLECFALNFKMILKIKFLWCVVFGSIYFCIRFSTNTVDFGTAKEVATTGPYYLGVLRVYLLVIVFGWLTKLK